MIKTQVLVQAIAFSGTQDEKVFSLTLSFDDDLEFLSNDLYEKARAYEQANKSTALFAAIEAKNGKKLTKPQRELLLLALEIQDGTEQSKPEDGSVLQEPKQDVPEPSDSSTVDTAAVQEQSEADDLEEVLTTEPEVEDEPFDEYLEEESGEEPTNSALEDAVNESLPDDSDGIDDALAALGL